MGRTIWLALALVGCAEDAVPDAIPAVEDPVVPIVEEPPVPCVATVDTLAPEHGAQLVPTDTVVEVRFTESVGEDWSLHIAGVSGTPALAADGRTAVFLPDHELEENTAFTVVAEVCDVHVETTFTTTPGPIDLEPGKIFSFPFADFSFTAPGSATYLVPYVDFESILMEVTALGADADSFDAVFTAGWPGGVPECPSVVAIDADFSANPYFATHTAAVDLAVTATTIPATLSFDELSLSGVMLPDGGVAGVKLEGVLDLRGVETMLGGMDMCDLASIFGDTCQPCADGEPRCLPVEGTLAEAPANPVLSITDMCTLP